MRLLLLQQLLFQLFIKLTTSTKSCASYHDLASRAFQTFVASSSPNLIDVENDLREALSQLESPSRSPQLNLPHSEDEYREVIRSNLALIEYLSEKSSALSSTSSTTSSTTSSPEIFKNLAWYAQVRNSLSDMNQWQGLQANTIVNRETLSNLPLSFSFFDYGLTGKVCRSYQKEKTLRFDARNEYLDMLKRGLTYYMYEELPHGTMPIVDWDLHYRMRDSQNNPPEFKRHGLGVTTLPLGALDLVQYAIQDVIENNVPGDIVEAGVWRGGLAILMAATIRAYSSNKILYACDSYSGIPMVQHDQDVNRWTERYAVSKSEVMKNFARFGMLSEDRVKFVEGYFNESLKGKNIPSALSVVHIDGDAFDSTMDVLIEAYPRLSVGGYVIVDDFHLSGCRDAVIQYRKLRNITEPLLPIPHDYVMTCKRGNGTVNDRPLVMQGPRSAYWKRRKSEVELVGSSSSNVSSN
jgi:hypothetical protein